MCNCVVPVDIRIVRNGIKRMHSSTKSKPQRIEVLFDRDSGSFCGISLT